MNSPWDPRFSKEFYLVISVDGEYEIFKDLEEAESFLDKSFEKSDTDGFASIHKVLPSIFRGRR